ncbi:apolipoprotein C-I [Cololabis saira]|uniref:apolipoprotein C-I n=1 Tax=Cololabis saira TaxID=129043 RepID=UPI002AD4A936|nr:apolipoprotein C-I [Cololabis saira]
MRLYLAVALLMVALVAFTEAQEAGIEEKFTKFGEQMSEFGRNFAEKAKDTFQNIGNSEFGETTRNWFTEQFEKIKSSVSK